MIHSTKQKGIALLMLLVIIVLAVTSYYMSELSMTEIKVERELKTLAALNKAKQALIAYAVNYPKDHARGPGFFPCPDTNNDGIEQTGCNGAVDTVGRLPWKRLNVGDLRDDANERLWYAVSVNFDFTNNPERPSPPYPPDTPKAINTESIGNITVRDRNNNIIHDGTSIDAAVAVIIAPGEALTRDDGVVQVRSTNAEKNDPVNYLDIDTTSGEDNAVFQQGILGDTVQDGFIDGEITNASGATIVNDRIMIITYDDIMEQVHRRVSREIGNVMNEYVVAHGDYPNAADITSATPLVDGTFNPIVAGPYNSVGVLQKGLLPIDTALPFDWDAVIKFPDWVKAEGWHLNTYYQFTATNPCTSNCLEVNVATDVAALIIFAGRELATQDRDALPDMSAYFEVENNNGDLIFDANQIEDYVHVIAP